MLSASRWLWKSHIGSLNRRKWKNISHWWLFSFFLFVFFFCIENLPTGLQSPCSCVSRQLPVLTFVSSHSRCPCHCAVVLQGLVDCGLLQCISSRPKLLPSASQQARLGILIGLHLCACVCLSVCVSVCVLCVAAPQRHISAVLAVERPES